MADGGDVIFKFKGETKGVDDAEKKVNKSMSNIGSTALKVAGVITTALGGAIATVGTMAIKARGNIEQSIGGVETLFKENADEVIKNAKRAYKTAGVDANKYMEQVTSFSASLLQGLKGDTKKAAQYADRAITDMADNANKFGTSMDMIQNAYQGFAKANYTMLDNLKLGYGGTKTEMQRLIKDASKMTKVQKELGITVDASSMSFDNIVNAISVVQSNMGVMGTTAKEASETLIGSVNSAKSAWQNFLSGSGDLKTVIDAGKVAMENVIRIVKEMAPQVWQSIKDVLPESLKEALRNIKPLVQDVIKVLKNVATWGVKAFKDIAKWASSVLQTLYKFKGVILNVGALFVAFKTGAKIMTGLQLAIKGSEKATIGYKLAVKAFNAVQAIWNGLLAAKSALVAIVTGKMTLASAATTLWSAAQAKLNAVMSANLIGVVLAGVVALTGAIIAINAVYNKGTEEEKKYAEAMKNLKEETAKTRKEFEEMETSRKESISGIQSQFDYTQQLANELKTLADESGRVKDTDKARAEFIIGQLNDALGTEYKMTGNVIENYQKLQTEIDKLIEKKRAEALFGAYEQDYKEYLKKTKDLKKNTQKVYDDWAKANENFMKKQSKTNAKALADATDAWNNHEASVKSAYGGIEQYETAYIAMLEGDFTKVEAILNKESTEFTKMSNSVISEAQRLGYKVPQEIMEAYDKSQERTGYVFKNSGSNMIKNTQDGIISKKADIIRSLDDVINSLKSNAGNKLSFAEFQKYGGNLMSGLSAGIRNSITLPVQAMKTVADRVAKAFTVPNLIKSPSRLFMQYGQYIDEGLVIGLTKGEKDIYSTMDKIASNMAFDTNELFAMSPTLNNSLSQSSNVNVQVYNNMEMDLMGNLVNNIKTYSNGSKNDYNYGMA